MKNKTIRALVFFAHIAVASSIFGQTASSYEGISATDSEIYTWVVVSGDMTGGMYNHTYYAQNGIGSVGGMHSAGPTTAAVTLRNDQTLTATDNVEYTWLRSTSAYCDFVGSTAPFYQTASTESLISIKRTFGKNTRGFQDISGLRFCGMTPDCINGVTPACGNPNFTVVKDTVTPCPTYYKTAFLAVRTSTSSSYDCYGISNADGGPGPGFCDQ